MLYFLSLESDYRLDFLPNNQYEQDAARHIKYIIDSGNYLLEIEMQFIENYKNYRF